MGTALDISECLDELEEMVTQHCTCMKGFHYSNELDSMCLSANADAMLLLEKAGRLKVTANAGRRILGTWIKKEERKMEKTQEKVLGDVYPCPFDDCAHHSRCCGAGNFGQDEQFVPEITIERKRGGEVAIQEQPSKTSVVICHSWKESDDRKWLREHPDLTLLTFTQTTPQGDEE